MRNGDDAVPQLSLVAPMYNESELIEEFVAKTLDALRDYPGGFELLCVDDGSNDDTPRILRGLSANDARVRVIRLARNYGQQMALMAGMDHAQGATVVLIDADLQRSPYSIPTLTAALDGATDVVFGTRPDRQDATHRRAASRLVARLLVRVTGNSIPDATTAFVAMRREFVERLSKHRSRSRVLSYLLLSLSRGRCKAVETPHEPRRGSPSKQRLRPLLGLVLSICLEASIGLPEVMWLLAALHACLAIMASGVCVVLAFVHVGEPAKPITVGLVVALVAAATGYAIAVLCAALALHAHYLSRIWRETQNVPPYVAWEERPHVK